MLREVNEHPRSFTFRLDGGRLARRSIAIRGGKQAVGLGFALFEDAHWPNLKISVENVDDDELPSAK